MNSATLQADSVLIRQLGEALQAASDHLDYCGYGDKWERECAEAAKLPQQIEKALEIWTLRK